MISSYIKKQLLIFSIMALTAVLVIVFVYAHIPTVLGIGQMKVTAYFNDGAGIYVNSNVTIRGVQVGKVTTVALSPQGIAVTMQMADDTKVGADARAEIHSVSAVGEQYVDLTPPTSPSSTYLHSGSVIPPSRTTTPLETATVLYDLERFVDSINPTDIQTIGREGAAAFAGTGPQLKSILADTTLIINQLSASEDNTLDLLHNASLLLHGAAAHASDFNQFTTSLQKITSTLAASTPTLDKFLDQAAPTTRLVNRVIADNGSAISVLLGNLATLSDIQVARIPGLRSLLVAVPEFGRKAPSIVHDGALQGAANINQDQPLCNTGLPLSNPISGKRSKIYAVNCNDGLVRGAANAPGASSSPSANTDSSVQLGPSALPTASGNGQVGSYDASTGLVSTSDGSLVRLGTNGGQEKLLGANSWQAMLLAVTGG